MFVSHARDFSDTMYCGAQSEVRQAACMSIMERRTLPRARLAASSTVAAGGVSTSSRIRTLEPSFAQLGVAIPFSKPPSAAY